MCFNGPVEKLNDTEYAQSAILLTSTAIASVLKNRMEVDYVAGLSLGEYSALTYADVFSLKDAMEITKARGGIMANALLDGTSSMAAVLGGDDELIKDVCNRVSDLGVCEIANYNCPGQTVISGEVEAIEKAITTLKEEGIRRIMPLNVSGAFHCSLLENASLELGKILEKYDIKAPSIPVVYNISGTELDNDIKDILVKQIKNSVYFKQSIEYMISKGVDLFIEIGPGKTLSTFVRKINREVQVYTIDSIEKMKELSEVLKWQEKLR